MFYQQHVESLKKLQHQHPPTWTKLSALRVWSTRKLHQMVKANECSVKESYRQFNNHHPIIAVQAIPKFSTIKRKMYEATADSKPKLPTNCRGTFLINLLQRNI